MRGVRQLLGVVGIAFIATIGIVLAQSAAPAASSGLKAFAQANERSVTTRVTTWTRARLAAAKKRWAQNQEKFSECVRRLDEQQKAKRLSLHNQGHFLDNCMSQNP
jgi:lysyl-tRNA synthetase class I